MSLKVTEGKIVMRQWHQGSGLTESPRSFHTLEELYAQCLNAANPDLIDRIVIAGEDEQGQPRVMTFVFQSITVSAQK
jgi:hypothetical protein